MTRSTLRTPDFPEAELARHGLRPETPDKFALGLYAAVPEAVLATVGNARMNLRISTPTADEYASALVQQGLRGFAQAIRNALPEV